MALVRPTREQADWALMHGIPLDDRRLHFWQERVPPEREADAALEARNAAGHLRDDVVTRVLYVWEFCGDERSTAYGRFRWRPLLHAHGPLPWEREEPAYGTSSSSIYMRGFVEGTHHVTRGHGRSRS